MLIDRKHTPWFFVTLLLSVATVALYLWDAPNHPSGPAGNTVLGIVFGSVALAIMLFLVALGLKRRVPHWRLGSAASWMRAHIWLGLLTPLLVALHGAFKLGGTMTTVLWLLLAVVWLSGVFGLLLQQALPTMLRHSVRQETVAQQLGRELDSLILLAEGKTQTMGKRIRVVTSGIVQRCVGLSLHETVPPLEGDALDDKAVAALVKRNDPIPGAEPIRRFYLDEVRPFLRGDTRAKLNDLSSSEAMFESVRTSSPTHLHKSVDQLETLCQRRRELLRQRMLMRLLMTWLFVHAPLSWALVLGSIVHGIIALRY